MQTYLSDSANETKLANASARANGQQTALINYFQNNAGAITTPDALLKNYKALTVVLGAFNLSGDINNTALLRQLLTQDPTSKTSLAHRSGNAKYLSFATALSTWTAPPFATATAVNSIVSAYKTNLFEATADQQSAGLRQALYFTRIAGSITTVTQLQSDKDLIAVAVTGLGLPLTAYDNLSFSQQTALIKQKLNLADLKKPAYVQHLAELFLVQQQLAASNTVPTVAAGSVVSLFSGGGDTSGNGVLTILESNLGTNSLLGGSTTRPSSVLSLFA